MMKHYSVLLDECIEGLNIKKDGIYIDGTLGRAGHSLKIVEQLTTGHLYCFDKDQEAIKQSKEVLKNYLDKVTFIHDDFKNMKERLAEFNVFAVDGILLDLGVSSPQFDDGERGFSYRFDAKLDMRMNQEQKLTAYDIVNTYDFHKLVKILFEYAEEKNAKLIARGIEKNRSIKPITTTFELVEVIKQSLPMKVLSKKGHPAKKTFQALRLEVNGELDSLKDGLIDAIDLLNEEGRLVIITFHSLEDRIVKNMYNSVTKLPKIDKRIPILPEHELTAKYKLVNRKPIYPTEKELSENHRSHSAKLRILQKGVK